MYLTIDIGGTKTLIALFSAHGRILRKKKFPTPVKVDDFLNKLFTQLQFFTYVRPKNIVIAIPGLVKHNRPTWFGNRPWFSPPIYDEVHNLFPNCPIYFKNDSDLAALYEIKSYPKKSVVFLTFGTGIGGSLAKDGELTKASASFEPGHNIVLWKNRPLEWEDVASSKAIRKVNHGEDVTKITDPHKNDLIAARLAIGLVPILKQKRPDIVIIGGPLGEIFRYFRPTLTQLVKIGLKNTTIPVPKLKKAKRPKQSVSYGAYLYGKSKAQEAQKRSTLENEQ